MNRLWYVWTGVGGGATGNPPSGPTRQPPVLAATREEAIEKVQAKLTSWDGPIEFATTDETYTPRQVTVW